MKLTKTQREMQEIYILTPSIPNLFCIDEKIYFKLGDKTKVCMREQLVAEWLVYHEKR